MNLFLVFTEKNKLFKLMNKYKKIAKNKNENKNKRGKLMLATFIRSIIIYIIVLIVMRLMGKREIGQMQPFELAISIMIADLASYWNSNFKWNNSNFRFTGNASSNICIEHKKQ